ncbi:hypothetical protein [Streptomyces yangpuensis]|uniref:hypothetical protein n=1 Tax=Streptomyces yangpuensis TaxID=1648182 RepID=UPI0034378F1C
MDEVLAGFAVEVRAPHVKAAQNRAAPGMEEHQTVFPRLVETYSEAEVEAAREIGPHRRVGLDVNRGGQPTRSILLLPPERKVESAPDPAPEDLVREGIDHHVIGVHPSPSASR